MNLSKKLLFGTTLLLMAGATLTGCVKQSSQSKGHTYHQTRMSSQEEAAEENGGLTKMEGVAEPEQLAMDLQQADLPEKDTNAPAYQDFIQGPPAVVEYQKPESVSRKEYHDPDDDPDGGEAKVIHINYNPKPQMKSYWKHMYHWIVKRGLNRMKPIKVVFHYDNHTYDGKDQHTYLVYTAMTNSPKLHDMHMKELNPRSQSGSVYQEMPAD